MAMELDLNSDVGEGAGLDEALFPLLTSANISCGFHAGDSSTARSALMLARRHGVRVGAHPGYADREYFGRREQDMTEDQIFELCVYQVGALAGLAGSVGETIRYIKPHGALYNQACREERFARPVASAAAQFGTPVIGLPGTPLAREASRRSGFFAEGFADRRYLPDGTLVPRDRPDAFVEDADEAVAQAERLCGQGVRTLCVHGDNPQALEFVRRLRDALSRRGIHLQAFT
jgi:UPF0271 protein